MGVCGRGGSFEKVVDDGGDVARRDRSDPFLAECGQEMTIENAGGLGDGRGLVLRLASLEEDRESFRCGWSIERSRNRRGAVKGGTRSLAGGLEGYSGVLTEGYSTASVFDGNEGLGVLSDADAEPTEITVP